ncbi:MAG: FGGY-family carbohydrate kinase [Clostridiales bacterium]|jgi:sugar (pentulose or hexulose) kinase|nr:FGGY-family carbohydrate kinase [Clostridiales bacterium]
MDTDGNVTEANGIPYALAIDFGTQSVRAIIFDAAGNTKGKLKLPFEQPYFSLNPNWAEQYAEFYWEKLCEATQGVKKAAPEAFAKIGVVAVTTVRDTMTCVDKNGEALRPFILWLDERKQGGAEDFPFLNRLIFSAVGMLETAAEQRQLAKCNWIRANEPEVWKNTYKYVQLSGYINGKLSGRIVDSVASQIGHIPFDYKKQKWQGKNALMACLYDLEPRMNIDLVPSGSVIGGITAKAAAETGIPEGTPLVAAGSDKGCETVGSGTVGDGVASISFGTTSTVQISTAKYVEPRPFIPAYPAVIDNMYNPELEIYRGFWMISWYKNNFAVGEEKRALDLGVSVEELLDDMLDETPVGNHGLVLQPFWSPGITTPGAKGAIIGFSDIHTKAHLYRAIIEGIGFGLLDGIKVLEKASGYSIKRVMASGGGSASVKVCQTMADIFGVPVQKTQTYENSALGAALTAYKGLGVFKTYEEAVAAMVHVAEEYNPIPEHHELYEEIFRDVYRKMYPTLKPIFKSIRKINKQ